MNPVLYLEALRPSRHEADLWIERKGLGEEISWGSRLFLQLQQQKPEARSQGACSPPSARLDPLQICQKNELLASQSFDFACDLPEDQFRTLFPAGEYVESPPLTLMCKNNSPPASKFKVSFILN